MFVVTSAVSRSRPTVRGTWTSSDAAYEQSQAWLTSLGNRRLELVAFGYHHPLMPLLDELDIRMQIKLHKHVYGRTWTDGSTYSRGAFPPETAFSERIIPSRVAEGIEWTLVDNIHFDRACVNYPHTNASNLFAPNRADQVNPDPVAAGGAWVQLNNLWAPRWSGRRGRRRRSTVTETSKPPSIGWSIWTTSAAG
jgi:predicted glycosyl hydrolase (DUF1957 family)